MPRRILVTGSSGFLGRHLCRLLAEGGDEPVGLDITGNDEASFTQVIGSVSDPKSWATAGAVDGIIHAAAVTSLWQRSAGLYDEVNREGAALAGRTARAAGVPLVLISSYTVLLTPVVKGARRLTGSEELEPRSLIGAYARSKRRGEIDAAKACPDLTILRPAAPIGPGDFSLTPPMRLAADLAAGKLPGVMAGHIQLCDIRDVAGAALQALQGGAAGRRIALGGHSLSLRAFADEVAGQAGVRPPLLTVPPQVALAAAGAEEALGRITGRSPKAPLAGVRMARIDARIDNGPAKKALGYETRPLQTSVRDALAFLRQADLLP